MIVTKYEGGLTIYEHVRNGDSVKGHAWECEGHKRTLIINPAFKAHTVAEARAFAAAIIAVADAVEREGKG